jgi:hypothetical protein
MPVGQRDDYQLVYAVSQKDFELADPFFVCAVATTDGKRFWVDPGDITAFYPPISGNGAKDGYTHGVEYGLLSDRLGAAFGLSHVTDDHPFAADDGGVTHIHGIEANGFIFGKEMKIDMETPEQGDKAFILIHSPGKVRAAQIVEPLPLPANGVIVHKGIFGMFEDKAFDGCNI